MVNKGRPSLKRIVKDALPEVRKGTDWQQIQNEILNDWEGLTNLDGDSEFILEAIRIAEDAVSEYPGDENMQLRWATSFCDQELAA